MKCHFCPRMVDVAADTILVRCWKCTHFAVLRGPNGWLHPELEITDDMIKTAQKAAKSQ